MQEEPTEYRLWVHTGTSYINWSFSHGINSLTQARGTEKSQENTGEMGREKEEVKEE